MLQPWEQYDDDTLGGFEWGRNVIQPAVGQGVNFGLNWLANRGNRQGGQQQRNLRGSGLIDLMAAEYQAMQSAGASLEERLQFSQAALQVVNDPQFGPWDSEAYRQQAVQVWTNNIRVLQQQMGNATPAATGSTPGTLTPSPTTGGIDNKTLLMFGGAALVLLLLTRD